MCGIAGFWAFKPTCDLNKLALAMERALIHRGPDSQKHWLCEGNNVCLVHARLAVIDISEAGAQPMHSPCGRYTVTYNGEIYNHAEIRARITKERPRIWWRGTSDTETLLMAITLWGFEYALSILTGMFAIVLWDRSNKTLNLARDRMGEKPLYYGWVGDCFVFGSELKAIREHPDFKPAINTDALRLFIETATVPSPYCIFENLYKLPPASIISIAGINDLPEPQSYWSIKPEQASNVKHSSVEQTQDWLYQLDKQLTTSVEMQMASDVPLGAFLSGGYDSSLVVALMQKASQQRVKTFSIGFDNPEFDEAPYAKEVAKHLGTEHREQYVAADDIQRLIPQLPLIWDEPFADPSQLPTHIVSAMTREHVTVALSGDGGDELFGGYTRYQKSEAIWQKVKTVPKPLRYVIDNLVAPLTQRQLHGFNARSAEGRSEWVSRLERINRYMQLIGSDSKTQLYQRMIKHSGAADALVKLDGSSQENNIVAAGVEKLDFIHHMIYTDIHNYLPDTILTKVDRAAMAVGLETRAPLLDHALVELAWSMPKDLKIRSGQSKWCLKSIAHQYIPQELLERPKKGFGVPLADWLRGPLKVWADALLSTERLNKDGYFNTDEVRGLWVTHLSGNWSYENVLWNILMFQMWLDANVND